MVYILFFSFKFQIQATQQAAHEAGELYWPSSAGSTKKLKYFSDFQARNQQMHSVSGEIISSKAGR